MVVLRLLGAVWRLVPLPLPGTGRHRQQQQQRQRQQQQSDLPHKDGDPDGDQHGDQNSTCQSGIPNEQHHHGATGVTHQAAHEGDQQPGDMNHHVQQGVGLHPRYQVSHHGQTAQQSSSAAVLPAYESYAYQQHQQEALAGLAMPRTSTPAQDSTNHMPHADMGVHNTSGQALPMPHASSATPVPMPHASPATPVPMQPSHLAMGARSGSDAGAATTSSTTVSTTSTGGSSTTDATTDLVAYSSAQESFEVGTRHYGLAWEDGGTDYRGTHIDGTNSSAGAPVAGASVAGASGAGAGAGAVPSAVLGAAAGPGPAPSPLLSSPLLLPAPSVLTIPGAALDAAADAGAGHDRGFGSGSGSGSDPRDGDPAAAQPLPPPPPASPSASLYLDPDQLLISSKPLGRGSEGVVLEGSYHGRVRGRPST